MSTPLTTLYRESAQAQDFCEEGVCEIDDNAPVSLSDGGAYVQAWVYVDNDDLDISTSTLVCAFMDNEQTSFTAIDGRPLSQVCLELGATLLPGNVWRFEDGSSIVDLNDHWEDRPCP